MVGIPSTDQDAQVAMTSTRSPNTLQSPFETPTGGDEVALNMDAHEFLMASSHSRESSEAIHPNLDYKTCCKLSCQKAILSNKDILTLA